MAGAGGHMVLQVIALSLLGRLLTPADFGVVTVALVVVNFSSIFAQLGLNQSLVQQATLSRNAAGSAFVISMLLGTLLCLAVYLLAPGIASSLGLVDAAPILQVLGVVFILRAAGATAEALLVRALRFRLVALLDLLSYGIGYGVVGVTLAWLGAGPWALVMGHLSQAALRTILTLSMRPHELVGPIGGPFVRQALRFGGGFSMSRVANYVALQADNLVVARTLGADAAGAYSRAYQLMGMPASLIGNALDRVLFPTFARQQDDRSALLENYVRGTAIVTLLSLPLGVVAAVLAPEAVLLVLGDQWQATVAPFQVFALTLSFRVLDRLNAVVVRAVGVVYRRAFLQIAYAVGVIALALAGSHYGLTGVALGVAAALVGNCLSGVWLSLRVLSGDARSVVTGATTAVPATGLIAAAALLGAWSTRALELPAWGVVVATIGLCTSLAALAVWLAPRWWFGALATWVATNARDVLPTPRPALTRWLARLERGA